MAFQPPADALTYEPFFGLNEKPFSLEADPKFVYDSPAYATARKSLLAGIRRREGLQVLTGEIGTGKTTLCRTVLRDLGRNTYSSLVPDPFAAREDLLKMLLLDFGVLSIDELTSGNLRQSSRTELGYLLAGFLNSLPRDAFAVAIIDEAQNLSLPLIEETRILFDTFGAKGRLQIVFVGQPELHAKLKLPEMRQVDQRICGYHRLSPMNVEAVAGYIQHRLAAAGARGDRVLFPPAMVDALSRRSGGVPRLINRVADRALQIAFERRAERVDQAILDAALGEVGSTTLSPTWDSIIFAQPPAAAPPAAPAASPPPAARTATRREADDFQKEIEDWVKHDLTPERRETAPPVVEKLDDLPAPRRSVPKPVAKRATPARTVTTDWPRHVTPETYIQRLMRTWMKRAAIAFGAFVIINVAVAAVMTWNARASAALPEQPAAPERVLPSMALPAVSEAPATVLPVRPDAGVAATAAGTGDFLVSVGLFATSERADALVETLTQAGLPALQRPFQTRLREVQQVVLGPFFSRADAAAELRRLQALGGYDDAKVINAN